MSYVVLIWHSFMLCMFVHPFVLFKYLLLKAVHPINTLGSLHRHCGKEEYYAATGSVRVGQFKIAAQAAVKLLQTRGIASTSSLGGAVHPEPSG